MSLLPREIDELRQSLERRRTELISDIRNALEHSDNENYDALAGQLRDAGENSVADVLVDTRLAGMERETDEMREVRDALGRMQRNEYGLCIDCGRQIMRDRLFAEPTAARCIRCQEVWEHLHGEDRSPQL